MEHKHFGKLCAHVGTKVSKVQNLAWILRRWSEVRYIVFVRKPIVHRFESDAFVCDDNIMFAYLDDAIYVSSFADESVFRSKFDRKNGLFEGCVAYSHFLTPEQEKLVRMVERG